jgi:hypothetical protein
MIVASYQLGIARFAALSLIEKVEALAKAAADFEKKLGVKGRALGHPAEHPSDYLVVKIRRKSPERLQQFQ